MFSFDKSSFRFGGWGTLDSFRLDEMSECISCIDKVTKNVFCNGGFFLRQYLVMIE